MLGLGLGINRRIIQIGFVGKIISIFRKRVLSDGGIFEASTCLKNDITYLGANISSSNSLGYFYDASLLNTPNAYSQSVMYSIVPQSSSNGDLSFTRLSTATRINGSGQLETLGIDVPVLNYTSGSSCPTWKFGKELTNLFRDSEVIGGISGINYSSVDVNLDNDWGVGLGKKGAFQPGLESNTLDATAGSGLIEGNLYTIGAFVRRTDGQLPVEGIANISTNDFAFTIAINNTSTAGKIKRDPIHVGNGVWFFQATIPAGNNTVWTGIRKRTAMSNDATEFSGIILVEGNVELDPSDYISTNGSAVTRLSDFSYTPNLISNGLISSGSGTMLVEFESLQGAPYYPLDRVSGSIGAYSLRKLSSLYTGSAVELVRDWDSASIDIGFNSNGDFDTTSALNWVYAYTQSIADIGGGAAAAYSLRKISENYTGSAIEVRRASDNVSASFGFDINGDLDTGSLLTWTNNLDQPLLDYASGSAAAYSLRKLSTNYTGSAIEVRRSSDNASASFGFDSNGDLDTTALTTFVNTEITDDINTTTDSNADGLADGLVKLTNNPTATIVTGNGHIGSAQRMEYNVGGGNLQSIGINTLDTLIGQEITVSFMYRSNISFSLGNGNSNAGGGFISIPANTGDAIRYEHKGVWSPGGGTDGRLQPMWLQNAGDFIEISDWSVTYHTADGHIKTWYDQSGNNNHATQTTNNDYQPKIVNTGSLVTENSKVAIDFDGTDDELGFLADISATGVSSVIVAKAITYNVNDRFFGWRNSTHSFLSVLMQAGSSSTLRGMSQTSVNTQSLEYTGVDYTNQSLISMYNASVWGINGNEFTTVGTEVAAGVRSTNGLTLGSRGDGNNHGNIRFQEAIFFNSNQSSNRTGIETNINAYYNIYTNPSASAFVKTWYDQSGNNNYATQTTNDNQPLIVNTGSLVLENGKPAIDFDGVDDYLEFASGLFVSEHSIFATIKQDNQDGAIIAISSGGGYYLRYTTITPSSLLWYIPDTTNSTLSFSNETSNQELITAIKGFANVYSYINGGNETTRPSTGNLTSTPSAIGRYAGSNYFGGDMQELILYPSDQSSNRTTIETNINNYYNIYTASVENHGRVKTWYDQSGNDNHATQLTSSYQPLVISSGSLVLENGKAAIQFDGADDVLQIDNTLGVLSDATVFQVYKKGVVSSAGTFGSTLNNSLGYVRENTRERVFRVNWGDRSFSDNRIAPFRELVTFLHSTTDDYVELFRDGESKGTDVSLSIINPTNLIGYLGGVNNYYFLGTIQSLIFYPDNKLEYRTLLETNLNDYYDIYPQSASINIITLESGSDALGYGLANESTKFRYLYKTNDINHLLVSQSTTLDRGVFKWDSNGVKIFSEGQLITSSSIVPTNTNWNDNLILNGAKVDFNLKQIMFFTGSLDDTTCANLSLYGSEWYKTFNQMANDLNYDIS